MTVSDVDGGGTGGLRAGTSAPNGPLSPWEAIRASPAVFLRSWWPLRALCYLIATPVVLTVWVLCCWPLAVFAGVPLGVVERARLRWVYRGPIRSPHRRRGAWSVDTATWSELFHGLLLLPLSMLNLLLLVGFVVMPLGLLGYPVLALLDGGPMAVAPVTLVGSFGVGVVWLVVGSCVVGAGASGQAYLARVLLTRGAESELRSRVAELSRSRSRVARAFDIERRRIERDLHDGAQQRITSVIVLLGMARYQLGELPPETGRLLDQARDQARNALDELRELVRGIYPAVLRDHGLAAALTDIAESSPVPVDVSVDLPGQCAEEVAAAIYFAVKEALANVNKHSSASRVTLSAGCRDGVLTVAVRDNGMGGARPVEGSGLVGIRDRIEAVGGTMVVTSPVGGPTTMEIEVPCASC